MSVRTGAIRYFATIKNGSTPASGEATYWDGDVAWATPDDLGRLSGNFIAETKRAITSLAVFENNLNVVPTDTVLISTRAPIGHMGITRAPMAFNQGCRALIPNSGTHGPYLLYLLQSRVPELNACANGTTFVELSRDDLASIRVALPPLDAQRRVAAFLDEKTAQTDALIEKKQVLLERLTEKRQAIITRAVTKGINPAAPMKPSGIDWLGEIPAHWEVAPLRWYLRTRSGDGLTNENMSSESTDDRQVPVVGGNGLMGFTERPNLEDTVLVVGRVGALCGNVHALKEPSWVTDNALSIYGVRSYTRDYLLYVLRVRNLNTLAARNAQPLITGEIVRAQRVPQPPLEEQEIIAQHLMALVGQIEIVTERMRDSINLLLEHRSGLIKAAVTGQLEI